MKKKTSLTKAIDKNPNIFIVAIFCSVLPFFLPASLSWLFIAARIALFLPILICVWLYKENYSVWQNAVTTVSLLLISFTSTFFPAQTVILIYMLCFAVLVAILIYTLILVLKEKKKLSFINLVTWFFECLALSLIFIFKWRDYEYISNVICPFWQIWLVLAISIGGFITLKWLRKQMKFWGCFGSFALIVLLTFAMLGVSASHLNFALDTSEPEEIRATVVDTKRGTSRKGPDTYSIRVEIDGERFSIRVPRSEYDQYVPGDTYSFKKYEGAFGEAFYIANAYS